jgi:AraC family transcriptional regulator
MDGTVPSLVKITPERVAKRHIKLWRGVIAEVVHLAMPLVEVEISTYNTAFHLLVVCERGRRSQGETSVEGLRSTLRDTAHKMTFVPAGCRFHERRLIKSSECFVCFHIDRGGPLVDPELGFAEIEFAPRLFFFDAALWDTVLKLKALIEIPGKRNRLYAEALSVVLAHELFRLNDSIALSPSPVRGGLANWQHRLVTKYIEENLPNDISIAELAELVRLSPYHFCRIFKQSFGEPPHCYHTHRRIERAKALLANSSLSITEIALGVGFSETSSFSSAFRRVTKSTPTGYRRSLA